MTTANFQKTVRKVQTFGFQGEIIEDAAKRAFTKTIVSANAANNVFGRVFAITAGSDVLAQAGGAGVFAGVLIDPKTNVTAGYATGALDPTLTLRNNEVGTLIDMGIVIVPMASAATIGADVYYDPNPANPTAGKMSTINDATYTTQVPNCKIVRHNTTAPGLAIIQLTN
jgi:hypothetical protein